MANNKTGKGKPVRIPRYKKTEHFAPDATSRIAKLYKGVLGELGESVNRQGLEKTPERVAKAMQFLTQGYQLNPQEILRKALFDENYSEMVLVKDIEIFSLCEHHLVPFFGKAHVAYIPAGKICGLSKIARVVDCYARRLQVQERLTVEIRDCLQEVLKPVGVAVVIEAQHLCMQMRGVQKQNSVTTTSAFTGEFEKDSTRQEFISLISSRLH